MSAEDLAKAWEERRAKDANSFDVGDTLKSILEFFASGDSSRGGSWVRGGTKGRPGMDGGVAEGEPHTPKMERGNEDVDLHG